MQSPQDACQPLISPQIHCLTAQPVRSPEGQSPRAFHVGRLDASAGPTNPSEPYNRLSPSGSRGREGRRRDHPQSSGEPAGLLWSNRHCGQDLERHNGLEPSVFCLGSRRVAFTPVPLTGRYSITLRGAVNRPRVPSKCSDLGVPAPYGRNIAPMSVYLRRGRLIDVN